MSNKIYLDVPFILKDYVKQSGAKWDLNKKLWFITNENQKLDKYKIVYLDIPFDEKEDAKNAGAKWDMDKKSWYSSQMNISESHLKKYLGKNKTYYDIQFDDKDEFKKQGGKWDFKRKLWYSYEELDDFEEYMV